ncbi:MAG: TonB-dependent receptor [Acidobacteria bacterium]|nr:TonB-dependent receptor [Acidobacteriota bacterium]
MKHLNLIRVRWPYAVCLLTFIILLPAPAAFAQTGTGNVTGTVRDSQKSVIHNAQVTLTQTSTNITRKATTNDEGIYYFGSVPLGPYLLVVESTGFKKWEGRFEVQVGQHTVIDPTMEVGTPQETVTVTGAAPMIQTESMDVSNVMDSQRIQQLPLNGRNVSNLFNLTPGVEGGNNARVNGLKVGSLEVTMDGVSLVDRFGGGINRVEPGLDTVQEFRIETVGSDARYSRPANVTLATRSGTNELHGALFETHRNNAGGLVSRRREDTEGNFPKLIRNEFGVSAGGPVILPKKIFGPLGMDGRNKLFWFGAFEGLRQRARRFTLYDTTPTDAMWNGDLSNMVDVNGNKWTIYDPLTTDAAGNRLPFPGNIIPASRISPIAKTLRALTAGPTNSNNPHQAPNFEKFYGDNLDTDKLTVKADAALTAKDNLSVRWTRGARKSVVEGGVFGAPINVDAGVGTGRSETEVHNFSITQTHTFSPTFLNELLVGVQRSNHGQGTLADDTDWANRLGFPNPFGVTGWPTFYADPAGSTFFGWDSDNRHNQALTGGVIEDNVTWVKGQHSIQFGGKIRKEWNNVRELQQAQGSHNFGGPWTSQYSPADDAAVAFTGSGFADMLLGLPDFLSNQYNRGYFYFRQTEYGLYFNDRWKVTPRLTLNLGVRWDKWKPYSEKYNRLVVPDIERVFNSFQVATPGDVKIETLPNVPPAVLASWSLRGLTYTTANQLGMPSGLFAPDNNNFGPRIGAAFKINNKMVLRGGYGEYFWTMPLSQILQSTRNNAPLNLRFTNDPYAKNATFNYPLVARPVSSDFVGGAAVDTNGIVSISPNPSLATIWDARNWSDGRAQSWHATLEYELPFKTAMRLSYVGEHARDLEQQFELNTREAEYNYVVRTGQAPPANRNLLRQNKDWDFIALNRSGYSNTHLGQIEFERRFANGLAFQGFYVYTRSLTTTDQGGFTSGNVGINSGGGGGRVPENRQILGSPNLSYDERLRLVYFNSTNVPPHRIRYNGLYDLPFGRGKTFGKGAGGMLNQVIGGWQVAFIGDWRSGLWGSASTALYAFGDPTLRADERVEMTIFGNRQRLWFRGDFDPTLAQNVTGGDLLSLVPANRAQRVLHQLGPNFNNRVPQTLADGTVRETPIGELYNPSPRGFYLGPGAWNFDLSFYKNFKFKERVETRFSADFFNIFNHPVDVGPDATTGLQDLSRQLNDPRIIQLSLRVVW